MGMMTKLRPYVSSFLREANEMFVIYIYMMGDSRYARERCKKSLDVVMGNEVAVLIVNDSKNAWSKHHEGNLIGIERYHFFASSYKQIMQNSKSLSMLKSDESGSDRILCTDFNDLKRTHRVFFNNITSTYVRSVLKIKLETGYWVGKIILHTKL